jgi:hypothetical protein
MTAMTSEQDFTHAQADGALILIRDVERAQPPSASLGE